MEVIISESFKITIHMVKSIFRKIQSCCSGDEDIAWPLEGQLVHYHIHKIPPMTLFQVT